MTHQVSNTVKRVAALAVMAGMVLPTFAFAEEGSTTVGVRGDASVGLGINFCTNLPNISTTLATRVPKREERRDDKMDKHITTVNGRFQVRLDKLDDHRDQWDENRDQRYDKLEARATTTAEKAAVTTFEANIDAAVKTRRAAVDAAVKTFQDGVNTLLANRQSTVDASFTTLKSAYDAALAKAKASCDGGTAAATVRATFVADIKAANQAFADATKPSTSLQASVEALRKTRDASVKAAIDAFQKTLNAEMVKLKAAFGISA